MYNLAPKVMNIFTFRAKIHFSLQASSFFSEKVIGMWKILLKYLIICYTTKRKTQGHNPSKWMKYTRVKTDAAFCNDNIRKKRKLA